MKKMETISIEDAKIRLRRSSSSHVINSGGFAVLAEPEGRQRYIEAADGKRYVTFSELRGLAQLRPRAQDSVNSSAANL